MKDLSWSKEDLKVFIDAIENPPEANEALILAAKK